MIGQAFKSKWLSYGLGSGPIFREIWLDLGSSQKVTMAFLQNGDEGSNYGGSETLGRAAFYISDDASSSNDVAADDSGFTRCTPDFLDGGFKTLTNCEGRYLILRRNTLAMESAASGTYMSINEIRAFTVTNLLEGASVTEAPDPKNSTFVVENLIENLELRSNI